MSQTLPLTRRRKAHTWKIDLYDASYVCVDNVDWKTYLRVSGSFDERPVKCTYANRVLEIMTLSAGHERDCQIINRLLEALSEELEVPFSGFGSTTFRREDLQTALEPDKCYYIKHEAQMRGVRRMDLKIHPPPDLVVEVKVTSCRVSREDIYAGMGVPELWKHDNGLLSARGLVQGAWKETEKSLSFPMLRVRELERFIKMGHQKGELTMLKSFRRWVRKELVRN